MRSHMTPFITRADITDMEEILALQYLAYQSEALIHGDFTIQPLTQTLEESIAEYHSGVVLKMVLGGVIIGSVRARAEGGSVHIGKLIVHPGHRGRGLGKLLLASIEREFPGKRYELFTSGKSARNLHLYEAAGYTRHSVKTDSAGIEFVFLEKQCENGGD